MNRYTTSLLVALIAVGCGNQDGVEVSRQDAETEIYREALVNADDVELSFESDGTRRQALAGEQSGLASLTADAVIGTNSLIVGNLAMMRIIASFPPTAIEDNARIWEGEDDGKFYQVRIEKSATPRGTRFDYTLLGRDAADANADLLPLIDGDVVRIETRPGVLGRQGFGVLRFHFDNVNTIDPSEGISGTGRIAFRRVGGVRQVRVRFLNFTSPNDPEFPPAAAYEYVQLPLGGGAMKWFSVGDVLKDGQPYENIAVHSAWRKDLSGVGAANVFGGSLDVDYWHLLECWDSTLLKGYEAIAVPGMNFNDGDAASCFAAPEDLDVPEYQDSLPDEDPEIPTAHPEEVETAE